VVVLVNNYFGWNEGDEAVRFIVAVIRAQIDNVIFSKKLNIIFAIICIFELNLGFWYAPELNCYESQFRK